MKARKYITQSEMSEILTTGNNGRDDVRNQCILLMSYIHGLRVSELTGLLLSDIDPTLGYIYIRRLKHGLSTQHPLIEEEKILLRKWLVIRGSLTGSIEPWLFISHRAGRISRQRIYALVKKRGVNANLNIQIHPHMLRHACGYGLANQGLDTRLIQDYLGHRNIRHTVIYTACNAQRFINAWAKI